MGKPLWRRAVDTAERSVGPHLERGVQTRAFADAVVLVRRTTAGVQRGVERRTRGVLHLVNLPAATDVRRLRRQVADLDREIRLLRDALETTLARKENEDGRTTSGSGAAGAGRRAAAGAPRRGAQRPARPQRDQAGDGKR